MGILLESTALECLSIILVFLWSIYSTITRDYLYWKKRGVPYIEPSFPFGTHQDNYLGKLHRGEMYEKYCKQFKTARYFGAYDSRRPMFIVKDPYLIKRILTKDFNHFTDRLAFPISQEDYISRHLFNMTGEDWKKMRLKMTPTFTTGRIKEMLFLLVKCSEQLKSHVGESVINDSIFDVKDVLARFTMDTIATCAFGLEVNSQIEMECEFYSYGISIFKLNFFGLVKRIIFFIFPILTKIFTMRFVSKDISDFFTRIVRDTVEYRESNNVSRNDFLELLIKVRQNRSLLKNEESVIQNTELQDTSGLTIEEITAQCFIFFLAGFETSSSTMSFCLYELACNPELQEKLYCEIQDVLSRHEGQITYQALQEMHYMDKVVNETLRRYASLATLNRVCTEPYKVPDSDLVLEKGQRVTIPVYAIHHDPEIYPEPYKFDPERFAADKVKERNPYVHLPFGEGPRMCIGMRFGLMQTKVGLATMVSNFIFNLAPNTPVPITINKRSFITLSEKPILLSLTRR